MSPPARWALTPPFHPYPDPDSYRDVAVYLCGTLCPTALKLQPFLLRSMAPYVVRTFLSDPDSYRAEAIRRPVSGAKVL